MGKASGTTKAGSSSNPKGLSSTNPGVEAMMAADIVKMRGANQPNIDTEAVRNLERQYDEAYPASAEMYRKYATYTDVKDESDGNDVLRILEDRGDRVLAASLVYGVGMALHPTEVILKSELEFHRTKAIAQNRNKNRFGRIS